MLCEIDVDKLAHRRRLEQPASPSQPLDASIAVCSVRSNYGAHGGGRVHLLDSGTPTVLPICRSEVEHVGGGSEKRGLHARLRSVSGAAARRDESAFVGRRASLPERESEKAPTCGALAKPSNGLEPLKPLLTIKA